MSEQMQGNGHDQQVVPQTEDFLTRLARDKDVDASKVRELAEVWLKLREEQRREAAEEAKRHFNAAMTAAQAEYPVMGRDAPNQQTKSRYARFETIWEDCRPIWTKHGLSVSFPSITTEKGDVRMSCRVRHIGGHIEEITGTDAPPDIAGPHGTVTKTVVQGNQSTRTYLKRGLLCEAMGIATRYEDDDGNSAARATGSPQTAPGRPPPPPQRPEARRPVDAPDGPGEPTWIERTEAHLKGLAKGRWKAAFLDFVAKAPTVADLERLHFMANVYLVEAGASEATKTEVMAAIHAARHRLQPVSRYVLVDQWGEVVGEHTSAQFYARAVVELWGRLSPDDGVTVLNNNDGDISRARADREAAKVFASIEAAEDFMKQTPPPAEEQQDPDETWGDDMIGRVKGCVDNVAFEALYAEAKPKMRFYQTNRRILFNRVLRAFEEAKGRLGAQA